MSPRGANVRLRLVLLAAAVAAAFAAAALAVGLPLASRGGLAPRALAWVVAASAAFGLVTGLLALWRSVARPVERLLSAAERLAAASPGELPLLGEPGGPPLMRAAVAFERLTAALETERERLAAKVEELTAANRALAETRESLLRSEKLATVGRLASGVAHEVGNPLGAITGYLDLARARGQEGRGAEVDEYLQRIAAEVRRIDRTVRELLDFARPVRSALAPIDLGSAVDASLRLAGVQSRFREVEVDLDLPADLPRVMADEHGLAQVLLNLLLNAGDAMSGRGRLRLSARAAPGSRVRLEVADRGPGISREDLPRIFDPFFTTKEPGKGAGLGLAICHRIMESFGGEISAANGTDGGAVFTLTFAQAAAARP